MNSESSRWRFGSAECKCSIMNAREEKLMDDEGRVQVRLICNSCGTILDSEIIPASIPKEQLATQETEAAEGAS